MGSCLEESNAAWQPVSRVRLPSWERPEVAGKQPFVELAHRSFDRGTFPILLQSVLYHFEKHAAHLPKATAWKYIERGLAAGEAHGWEGIAIASLRHLNESVYLISTAELYLVFSKDKVSGKPRIISYRDRLQRPF